MAKSFVNYKRDELNALSNNELVERILAYPNQDMLNSFGKYPLGKMAENARDHGYEMSDKVRHTLTHYFAAATMKEAPVVGVRKHDVDAADIAATPLEKDGAVSIHATQFQLRPMPSEDGRDMVGVFAFGREGSEEGMFQIGQMKPGVATEMGLTAGVTLNGTMTDYSNGKLKNVTYKVAVDFEHIARVQQMAAEARAVGRVIGDEADPAPLVKPESEPVQDACPAGGQVYRVKLEFEEDCATLMGDVPSFQAYLDEWGIDEHYRDDDGNDYRFNGKMERMSFHMETLQSGYVEAVTNAPLDERERKEMLEEIYLNCKYAGSNYLIENDREWCKTPNVFKLPESDDWEKKDWDMFKYTVTDRAEGDAKLAPEQPLITEGDLAFAEQMTLADIGITQ